MKYRVFYICLGVLLSAALLQSQTQMDISYSAMLDGSAFRNYENIEDMIQQPAFTLSHSQNGEAGGFQLFYTGSAFLFNEYTLRHYYSHNFGITGERWGESGSQTLAWGIQGGQRFNRDTYAYYNYQNADAYLNWQVNTETGPIWVLGGQLRYRHYQELNEFDNLESLAFVRGSFFFNTRTTVIGIVQAGYKAYTHALEDYAWIETVTGSGQQGRGRGNGGNASQDTAYTRVVTGESAQEGVFQMTASLRAAQSLTSRTGLAVEVMAQRNFNDGSRIMTGQDSGYESNDELYDDPYSYNQTELGIELTQMLPWQSQLKAGVLWGVKSYERPVYTLEGEIIEGSSREDRPRILSLSLSKSLAVGALAKSLVLSLDYVLVDNRSNDDYYRYRASVSRLGIDWHF